MADYVVRETDDYYPISEFLHENDVEITVSSVPAAPTLHIWRIDDPATGEIMAAILLQIRGGVYCVGGIAVGEKYRSRGLSRILLDLVTEGARQAGADYLWASAKEPEFYRRHNWETMDWDSSPKVAIHCPTCSRRGKSCHPEIMRIKL